MPFVPSNITVVETLTNDWINSSRTDTKKDEEQNTTSKTIKAINKPSDKSEFNKTNSEKENSKNETKPNICSTTWKQVKNNKYRKFSSNDKIIKRETIKRNSVVDIN